MHLLHLSYISRRIKGKFPLRNVFALQATSCLRPFSNIATNFILFLSRSSSVRLPILLRRIFAVLAAVVAASLFRYAASIEIKFLYILILHVTSAWPMLTEQLKSNYITRLYIQYIIPKHVPDEVLKLFRLYFVSVRNRT